MIPGISKSKNKRVIALGGARRGLIVTLGTASLLSEQEAELVRAIIDRIQEEAEGLAGEAAQGLMDSDPIR